jgi:20S proteasome alpha/beta subunit
MNLSATKLVSGQDVVVTGSGDSFYIEAAGKLLTKHAKENPDQTCDELAKGFGDILEDFFDRKVIPFAAFEDRPDFDLIIGIDRKDDRRLWTTNKATLLPSDLFSVVGSGGPFVSSSIAALLDPQITKPEKLRLEFAWKTAAYAVFLAKENVDGCGKHTHVAVIGDGAAGTIREANIAIIEHHLGRTSAEQLLSLQFSLGYEYEDETKAAETLMNKITYTRSRIKLLVDGTKIETSPEGLE